MNEAKKQPMGLVIVYTGNGKGKTTASLGMCIRAAGYKKKVKIIQFIKGSWHYGELDGIKLLSEFVDLEQMGKGFVGIIDDKEDISVHIAAAGKTLARSREVMLSGKYDILILDELNVALKLNLIKLDDVLELIRSKPESLHLVITGRDAHEKVIELADLVTEMKEIKHPFQKGILAQQGVDF
ncbi:MAG: cob(I)yrinic acid a,c-diamide adenosyltransferase [candidate division Zixibacteria bacterium]|nr:cob(I)yrinic acid a,c-diamide adenosyltransferase [candidate division Zixibacteria bacterium]MBU1470614.1 cob(I)yrinic acid a,c-diamide adenosyltransferase [candidate division Zixibacteria bacterium]MBU2624315.1 cob(I)yrinic acid a,c-diamide adenosyltransferase [candidate division Zixibacteria bacterium]